MMRRLAALPALTAMLLADPLRAVAQQAPAASPPVSCYGPGPWHMWGGPMWGGGYGAPFWWMFPMMLFFLVLFGVLVLVAWRAAGHRPHHWGPPWRPWGDPTQSALQILNERFARGEIQKDEYAEKKAALLSGGPR